MSRGGTGLLILSHSSRNTNMRFCNRAYLEHRYANPDRLADLPPLDYLPPIPAYFDGSLSFYRITRKKESLGVDPLGYIKCNKKIQHALPLDPKTLMVGFETHLEVWAFPVPLMDAGSLRKHGYQIIKTLRHPHFPGIRTVNRLDPERVLLSSASADAVFVVNWVKGELEHGFVMPENLYGKGYVLEPGLDLARNYIVNKYQRTHLNSAHAFEKKAVVSTLIQGAIGVFDLEDGRYREMTRGYVGCHGARFNRDGEVYFVDSCSGRLIFLDPDGGETRSYQIDSRWLHDAVQIVGNYYAFALADSNELQIHDIGKKTSVFRKRFLKSPVFIVNPIYRLLPGWVGNSTQFLSYRDMG